MAPTDSPWSKLLEDTFEGLTLPFRKSQKIRSKSSHMPHHPVNNGGQRSSSGLSSRRGGRPSTCKPTTRGTEFTKGPQSGSNKSQESLESALWSMEMQGNLTTRGCMAHVFCGKNTLHRNDTSLYNHSVSRYGGEE